MFYLVYIQTLCRLNENLDFDTLTILLANVLFFEIYSHSQTHTNHICKRARLKGTCFIGVRQNVTGQNVAVIITWAK